MKLFSWIIALPLVALCVLFAVNNRQEITLDLWPFGYVMSAPLYFVTLGGAFIGFLLGALMFWLRAIPARLQRHRLAQQVERLKSELEAEKAKNNLPAPPSATV